MKTRLDRIIGILTLTASLTAIFLVLRRPTPVTPPPAPAIAPRAQALNPSVDQVEPASKPAQTPQPAQASGGYSAGSSAASQSSLSLPASQSPKGGPQINSEEVSAAISQLLGAGGAAGLKPDSDVGSGAPNIKDQKVTYDGDVVHGQFLTEIGGKDVWVTISGRMGQKDGYATFDPTEFKVGDMEVPVALVNPALQRKLAEERDRLKVADPAAAK
jgi:hypothetical protein